MVHYDENETTTIFVVDYTYSENSIYYSYLLIKSQFINEDEAY